MLESIRFQNFKVLRDTTLPLRPFTLLVGPNGSGKSTALQPFLFCQRNEALSFSKIASASVRTRSDAAVEIAFKFAEPFERLTYDIRLTPDRQVHLSQGKVVDNQGQDRGTYRAQDLFGFLAKTRVYALDPRLLPERVSLQPNQELIAESPSFAGVLDRLRDLAPERFESLNKELGRLLPEFDRILFDTPTQGQRTFLLRTREGQHLIPASDLSQGTLLALTILTLAYLPDPPPLIALEEPDRGIHPRLLRSVQDALYRLAYPEQLGEKRAPVQVIATTQSPYFLDLFSEHPEEIVIAEKVGLEAKFQRLMDRPNMAEILDGTHALGEVWYSGVLGGVPARS